MESLKQYEMEDDDEIPLWATTLFGKMKEEICAEVHAKVAYSMRIMLDQLREDVKTTFEHLEAQKPSNEECFCKDLGKCKEKLAELWTSHLTVMKEERKQIKRVIQENKKCNRFQANYSESDTDNENSVETSFTQQSVTQMPVVMKFDPSKIPPVPPRRTSPLHSLAQATNTSIIDDANTSSVLQPVPVCNKEPKLLNGPATESLTVEDPVQFGKEKFCQEKSCTSLTAGTTEELSGNTHQLQNLSIAEAQLSPSDSEFEVISMPPNVNPVSEYARLPEEASHLISDYEDSSSSSSSDEGDTESGFEFKDCKSPTNETNDSQQSGSLYPELELKKMSLSMLSSTLTALDGYMSSCSVEGAMAEPIPEIAEKIERERAPYSVAPEEVERINSNEIVHIEPLPSEFLRNRKPYSHVPAGEEKQQQQKQQEQHKPPPPQQQQQQQQQYIPSSTRPQASRDSTYRVDNLPESLWDEALTVAAQTYNAAKTAVGNLADTFVPGVDKASGSVSRPSSSTGRVEPTPRATCMSPPVTQPSNSPVRTQPTAGMSLNELKLFEMGFLDRALNATLLRRHNENLDRVIAELIEP